MSYEIIVHNEQGASEVYCAETKSAINKWLDSWNKPEHLSARVTVPGDHRLGVIAEKEIGRKRLVWSK